MKDSKKKVIFTKYNDRNYNIAVENHGYGYNDSENNLADAMKRFNDAWTKVNWDNKAHLVLVGF